MDKTDIHKQEPAVQEGAQKGAQTEAPYWRTTPLESMSQTQWEALCDGCGRCCLVKLEDEDTGRIHATDIGCRLFNAETCRCNDYSNRSSEVHDCVTLKPALVRELPWLPPSCAYRLVAEGKDLAWWHPLVSGDAATVIEAGISVKGRVAALEDDVAEEDLPEHIAAWPMRWPKDASKIKTTKK